MVRQQLQSSLGISSFKGIDTYGTNRKPDSASKRSLFVHSLDLVNPVSSDGLALNDDRVVHHEVLSVSAERGKVYPR
jgi:hypothetical protein